MVSPDHKGASQKTYASDSLRTRVTTGVCFVAEKRLRRLCDAAAYIFFRRYFMKNKKQLLALVALIALVGILVGRG